MSTQHTAAKVAPRGPGRPRSETARKAVLRSTLVLLKRVGFNDLRMESVAARAGVGKATVYRWWPNKAELVIASFVSAVGEELRFPSAGPVLGSLHEQMKRWAPKFRRPLGPIVLTATCAGESETEIIETL